MERVSSGKSEAQAWVSWVLYDGSCAKCAAMAGRFRRPLRRRGFVTAPLQSLWVPAALQMTPTELLKEMRVMTARGETFGGADALLYLAHQFWWAKPLVWLARLPGAKQALHRAYRWIATHRHCIATSCEKEEARNTGGDSRNPA